MFGGDPWFITIGTIIGAGVYALIQYFAAGRQAVAMSGAQADPEGG
jgi:heat shock protein HtpX